MSMIRFLKKASRFTWIGYTYTGESYTYSGSYHQFDLDSDSVNDYLNQYQSEARKAVIAEKNSRTKRSVMHLVLSDKLYATPVSRKDVDQVILARYSSYFINCDYCNNVCKYCANSP
jgi:hypothetical protein